MVIISASKSSIRRFVITEKAPTRAFFWLKAATTAFTFKTLLRHYAKWALTPQSLDVKLGPRRNYHLRHYGNQPVPYDFCVLNVKALVGAFNQKKALVGAFSVIVQPVVEPMDRFAALLSNCWSQVLNPCNHFTHFWNCKVSLE